MKPSDFNAYALSDTSAEAPVEVKAVWEVEGEFHTLRLHGQGRVEAVREEPEFYGYGDFRVTGLDKMKYKFIVDIDDTFTIIKTEDDPRTRKVIADIKEINLESLQSGMKMRGVPENAGIEIEPYDGGNLVTFTWKEL